MHRRRLKSRDKGVGDSWNGGQVSIRFRPVAYYCGMAMKSLMLIVTTAMMLGACTHGLESMAESRRQARMDAANANRPLSSGAGDGLGWMVAQNENGTEKENKGH